MTWSARSIGSLRVSPLGLGCMNMSSGYGPGDDKVSARLLNKALDAGYTFLDTATLYGGGHNETLIGNALRSRRNEYVLASKCALSRVDGKNHIDGSPAALRAQCEASLTRLRTDVIDLYYLHRVDPAVPVEDSVGALGRLVEQGKLREIGLSEVAADTLKRAHREFPVAAVQSEYSLWTRTPEFAVLNACEELGIAFVPFSPLGRQFLTGKAQDISTLPGDDLRCTIARPRFEPDAFAHNVRLLKPFGEIADRENMTMAQLALTWLLAWRDTAGKQTLIPIPGTKHIEYMEENWGAVDGVISDATFAELDVLINESTVQGNRYSDARMADTDAERDRPEKTWSETQH